MVYNFHRSLVLGAAPQFQRVPDSKQRIGMEITSETAYFVGIGFSNDGFEEVVRLLKELDGQSDLAVLCFHDLVSQSSWSAMDETTAVEIAGLLRDLVPAESREVADNHSNSSLPAKMQPIGESIARIADSMQAETTHCFHGFQPSALSRLLQIRSPTSQVPQRDQSPDRSRDPAARHIELMSGLETSKTTFFYDAEAIQFLRDRVLQNLFDQYGPNETVRIWVAGCSTGEEAYTIAILCNELSDQLIDAPSFQIFATDIDARVLEQARSGSFGEEIEQTVSAERLRKFFTKSGKRYTVSKKIRSSVVFSRHDLMNDPPFSRQHLLLCRNLSSLNQSLQEKLLPLFHYCVSPLGYLMLGPGEETASYRLLFRTIDSKYRIAQRNEIENRSIAPLESRLWPLAHLSTRGHSVVPSFNWGSVREQMIAQEYAPASCIVDAKGIVLNASENAYRYLSMSNTHIPCDLTQIVENGLRFGLSEALKEARKTKRKVCVDNLSLQVKNKTQLVALSVQPLRQFGGDEEVYLVVFQDLGNPFDRPFAMDAMSNESRAASKRVSDLNNQIVNDPKEFDVSLHDMEVANEELKSANEELLSMIEELHAANEELETSKEEIFHASIAIEQAHSDLLNLIRSTRIATVFLDHDLRICNFTPAMFELYQLRPNDIGRLLSQCTPFASNMPPLPDPKSVRSDKPIEQTIVLDSGKSFIRRVLPYESLAGDVEGIVVTFQDVTELRASKAMFQSLVEVSSQIVWVANAAGEMVEDSPSWRAFTGQSFEQRKEKGWLDAIHPQDKDAFTRAWQKVLLSGEPLVHEHRLWHCSGEWKWTQVRAAAQRQYDGSILSWVGMNTDITERKRWELELSDREAQLRRVIDNSLCFIGVLDFRGVLLEANATAISAAGIQRDDVIGKDFADCYWWSYGDETVTAQLRDAIRRAASGEIVRYDTIVRMANNTRMTIDFMLSPVRDANGQVTHLIPSGVDISERKRAEQSAIDQANQLNLALEAGRMGIWTWDLQKDHVSWSKQLQGVFGEANGDFKSTKAEFLRRVHPEDRELLEHHFLASEAGSVRGHEFEFRVQPLLDQEAFWMHCSGTILVDSLGAPTSLVSVVVDITDRKKRELNLAFFAELESLFAKRLSTLEIMKIACARVAEHMQLTRCLLVEIDEEADTADVFFENSAMDFPSIVGKHRISNFHNNGEMVSFFTGQPIVIRDTRASSDAAAQAFAKLGVGALVNSCFVSEERVKYVLSAIKDKKHNWSEVDIKFLHDVASSIFARFARARAEEQLMRSQERLSMALESARMGSYDWEPESDTVLWDDQHLAITGLMHRKMKGRDFLRLVHPDDVESNRLAIERTLQGEGDYDIEFRIIREDGQIRWLAAHGKILRQEGRPPRFVGLNWDITDRKQTEMTIKLNEARLRIAAAAAGFAMLHLDLVQHTTTFSPETNRLIGLASTAPLHIGPGAAPEWIHPADVEDYKNHLRKTTELSEGTSISLDLRIVRPDGEIRWMRLHTKSIYSVQRDMRRPNQIIGTLLDITQQRQFEESLKSARQMAEAANKSKSIFLANMSHEIRTPMTAILGFSELLERNDLEDDPALISDAIQTIRTNATHLLSVINDILDMSKIEAGRMKVEQIAFSPVQILEEVMSLLKPRALGKGIQLELHFDTLLPKVIYSDPTRVRQILLNLVGNSIKFTEVGSVNIHVAYFVQSNQIQFRIVDSGIGMTPAQLSYVTSFEAFSQADDSTTRQFGGTGLGLRISNTLAKLLGGSILAESTMGVGSSFIATISANIPTANSNKEAVDDQESPIHSSITQTLTRSKALLDSKEQILAGLKILLVEDGPDNQKLISFHLKKSGAEVTVAENGLVAVELFESGKTFFDLVFMDIQMPEMDGIESTRRLRNSGFAVPIVAITAHAMESDRQKCLEAGCNAYATKPIGRDELVRLAELFGRSN